ncbi:MAG: glycoside hydrolase family 3 N-terminal domain-containing protein [Anaerolineales bacterium]|jgi:beta-N-acetylhexosaminidase|nr:glycoside hydrolase family 3 N-terminal domain-containing protein [Anaerolineales bacterium]
MRLLSAFLLALILFSLPLPLLSAQAQSDSDPKAAALLAKLTPEERVGQLFLITFQGNQVTPESQIYDLIANHHIGGVILTAANDNFVDAPETLNGAYSLVASLQDVEWQKSFKASDPAAPRTYVPLWVGIAQEGGGPPNDEILSGLTSLPDQMALGATWNTFLANDYGEVMGSELAALGFNLYLGLSLDVLSDPNPSLSADLSTRVFGGDPYWVSEMGKAFISGLRAGSEGRMAVIAKHFPGSGDTDRPIEQEIATVRRSLEELKQVELAPFFAITGNAPNPESTADGLLVSHIRYQGFQGNIRATTRPVSFDQQSLGEILSLPQFASWRQNGGIMLSDDLGTPAVRRFYDPGQTGFSARLVARDAFLAGNDLLYLGNIQSSDTEDSYTTILRILDFFTQKYREDPAFAKRVDESVLRLLALKYRLYPSFTLGTTRPQPGLIQDLKPSTDLTFEIARQAASLLSPSRAELSTVLPEPPGLRDYIIFFTDSRTSRQCSECLEQTVLPQNALQNSVLTLYGPQTGGLITPANLDSYSFDELALYLENDPASARLGSRLQRANWVVFSTLDLSEGRAQKELFKRFFAEKQSLLLNKRVLLFAFGAPYYLDATDISNLTAYYSLYSEAPPFVEVAARLLFQEITPVGASPVSIPGLGYDLISAMAPAPNQVIALSLDLPPAPIETKPAATIELSKTETPPAPVFKVGESISLRTGVILDHNGRLVPDGTVVKFILQAESSLIQQVESTTTQGVAKATFRIDQAGLIEIRASSEPATVSDVIQLDVSSDGGSALIITPTPEPTEIIEPTPISTPETVIPQNPLLNAGYPNIFGWMMVMLVLAGGSGITYWLVNQILDSRWAVRWAMFVLLGGLSAYNYLILELPGAVTWLNGRGLAAFLQAVILGQVAGVVFGWVWRFAARNTRKPHPQK